MPLHLDYRPKSFDEIIGNEAIIESLKSIFSRQEDFPHAIMFSGNSGCGKTTLGRIVKDVLGCKGSDYLELDGADNRKIENIRQIKNDMKYRPSVKGSKCRVYLLDECHQITGDAANALLKALEDTPNHVYFILCTTEPGKLIKTILNRCMSFEVQSLNRTQMKSLIDRVLEKEEFENFPEDITKQIIEFADGCPRQALVTLDQIIDMPFEKMSSAIQDINLGDKNTKDLCKGLLEGQSWKRISAILKLMDLSNSEQIRRAVVGWMAGVILRNDKPQAAMVYEEFKNPFYNNGKNDLIMACYKICVMSE